MDSGDTGTVKKHKGRPYGAKDKKPRKRGDERKKYTVSEKALAQRHENGEKNKIKLVTPEQIDYNTRLINHIMQISEIASHANLKDINSLKACFVQYLQLCQANGMPVQNLAAYSAMGFYNYSVFDYYCKKDDPEWRAFTSSVKSVCAMFREGMITDNKLNPVIGIFWQRNYDGLRNDTEQVQSAQEVDEDRGNTGYKEKYKKLIGGGE